MRNDLPISPKKKFKYSISFESWDEESLEAGQSDVRGYEVEDDTDTIGDILYKANTTYGIYMPVSFGTWESTEPDEDNDFWEKGIRKYYALHITNDDGTEISQEENDFITFLLSDGRYEIDKFRDYAVGGIVIGAVALGVGALITYFYFKGKKGNKNRAKSVTHTINGKERKYPIKDAWRKDHNVENKSQKYEVPQADRYEMGGDASEYYHEVEYGEGGVARAKDVIMNKIGLNEGNTDFLVSQSEKFSIWLADSIVKKFMIDRSENKKTILEDINRHPDYISRFYRSEIRQILDWLQHPVTPKQNLKELSFEQALEKARDWHNELQVLGGDIDFKEPEKNTIIKKYPKNSDGIEYYWVFIPSNYCDLESSRMGHCGRTGYGNKLISLRSVKPYGKGHTISDSHVTIAYSQSDNNDTENDGIFYQVKGKKNSKPAEKYFPYIFDLIKSILNGEINQRFKEENEESIKVVEYLMNEQKKIQEQILPQINFSFSSPSSTEYKFLKGELNRGDFEGDFYRYLSSQIPVYDNFRNIHKLNEKLNVVRNNREYEELVGEINRLREEAYTYYIENVVDKFKEIIRLSNLQKESEKGLMYFQFNGFGSEYGAEEDYGFEDMSNEELREIYELKPDVFNDAESILILFDHNVITAEELKKIIDGNQEFDAFGNQMKLYERGIISEPPSTILMISPSCDRVSRYLDLGRDFSDDLVENVLCGDIDNFYDNWSYYYDNWQDLLGNLNKENEQKIIDEIVRITGLDKSVVEENGIEYYLNGDDENFSQEEFDNIFRVLANAQNSADTSDYHNYLYSNIKSALEELGEVNSLNDEGAEIVIDMSNLMSLEDISGQMDYYEFTDIADLFEEELSRGSIDLPRLRIDDRYTPYGSREDFNDYISESDLESFAKGGSLRPKNINTKTKIKNMKPNQRKLAQGGDLGISKEDYFLVVHNWVYFTFNYPMGFVKDAFNSKHLEEKFSSSYERYGSVGVLMSFWANLDGNNREILALWIKNNYFSSSDDKSKLLKISDDDYAKIITHWNMFCFNFPYGFIQNVFGDNTSHFEMKWVRAYESAGSTGAVNKFFTELSMNNQRLLTDWVHDNYKGMTFADGGGVGNTLPKDLKKRLDNVNKYLKKYNGRELTEQEAIMWNVFNNSSSGWDAGNKAFYLSDANDFHTANNRVYHLIGDALIDISRKMTGVEYDNIDFRNNTEEENLKVYNEKYKNMGNKKFAEGGNAGDWSVTDITNAKYLGVIEFEDNEGEFHNFEIMETDDRLVFGGMTNSGFIESGYIEKDGFSTDETLQSLLEDLEVYYNDGAEYTSQIVFNQRMAKGGGVGNKSKFADGGEEGQYLSVDSIWMGNLEAEETEYMIYDGYAIATNVENGKKTRIEFPKLNELTKSQINKAMNYRFGSDWEAEGLKISPEDVMMSFGKIIGEAGIERPNRRMAQGGSADLEYSDILNVLKSKIDDSIEEIPMKYENSNDFKGEEVEHESRDGFIPFTDGGYEAVWFEQIGNMYGTGNNLPNKVLDDEMNRQINNNLEMAKESFIEKYPELVEELGQENIDYNSLYEAGYGDEAEELSEIESDYMWDEGTIMMQVTAYYYSPENSRGIDDKHTIRLFGDVNLESPYHRQGNLDDSYDIDFTFDSISELEEKMDAGLKEIISWFDGDMYNDSTAEMKIRRMEEGGESDDDDDDESDDDDDDYAGGGSASGKWIIEDWAGNHLFQDKVFDSFEDGWSFIYENIQEETEDDGTYDDYYVIQIPFEGFSYKKDKYAEGGEVYALVDKFDAKKQVYDQVYYKTNNYNEIIGYIADLKNEGEYDSDMQLIEVSLKGRMRKFDSSMLSNGGEVEDWMEEALASLIEETGYDDLEITYVVNSKIKYEFTASNGDVEYRVFQTEGDAEETAIEQVREDLEENPEYFNQDWLMYYINGRDFFEEALNEMNDSYVQDIESESDRKYANRLIAELVENGLMDEEDAESDNAEELADELKYDYVAFLTEDKLGEGNDGLDYFINNFGEEETYRMVRDNNLIDVGEASKDAVQTDGIGHFLSSYDGETLYLSDDCVAYRIN